jgi:hypothetical protein
MEPSAQIQLRRRLAGPFRHGHRQLYQSWGWRRDWNPSGHANRCERAAVPGSSRSHPLAIAVLLVILAAVVMYFT